jgi:Zn-dependent peptidase ImmA (M78 family)
MPSKSLLKRGFKAEAERLSEKYREELGVSKFDPLDAFVLADHLNIPVFTVKEVFKEDSSSLNTSILCDTSKFSAMWMPNIDGDKIIIHNDNHSLKRQQSNIMHELAHIIRKHEIPVELAILCNTFNLHYFNKEHEQEAKHLGACLQITRAGLQWALKNGYSKERISNYYNASIEMVRFRLNTSGVLIQNRFASKSNY